MLLWLQVHRGREDQRQVGHGWMCGRIGPSTYLHTLHVPVPLEHISIASEYTPAVREQMLVS